MPDLLASTSAKASPGGLLNEVPHLPLDPEDDCAHTPHSQGSHHILQAESHVEVVGNVQDLLSACPDQALGENAGKAARGRRLGRRIEVKVHGAIWIEVNVKEEWRLALDDSLKSIAIGHSGRQRRKATRVVEQRLQLHIPWGITK